MKTLYFITSSYLNTTSSVLLETVKSEGCCERESTNLLGLTGQDTPDIIILPSSDGFIEYPQGYLKYDITNLIVCSSLNKILAISGSTEIVTYPADCTTVVQYADYISASFTLINSTSSIIPSYSYSAGPWPNVGGYELITTLGWRVNTTGSYTAELPTLYQTLDNTFKIIQATTGSFPYIEPPPYITGSILVISSFNNSQGALTAPSGAQLVFELTGSGLYYNSQLRVSSPNSGGYYIDTTSSNQPISAIFYPSDVPAGYVGNTMYIIEATTTPLASLTINFIDTGSSPVLPLNDLQAWNAYFGISASNAIVTGSEVTIVGELLGHAITTPNGSGLSSIVITGSSINALEARGLNSAIEYDLRYNSQSSFPIISNSSSIEDLYLSNNQISGTLGVLSDYTSLRTFTAGNNLLSGSIPQLSYNLEYIDCRNNYLTGSITSITGSPYLKYYDVSNNLLTGSIPTLSGNTSLQHLDVSFNSCSGDIPSLSNNTQLTYVDLYQNQLSGSIPDLSNLSLLEFFDCGRNNLTGSIPNLDNNVLLQQFSCQENDLSGSLPSLTNNTALFAFDSSDNYLTGSIPDLSNNTALVAFSVSNNQLSGSIPDLSALSQLTVFNCALNNITGSIPNVNSNPVLAALIVSDNLLTGDIPYLGNTSMITISAADNQLTGYISGSVPATLKTFSAFNNQLSQPAVDGILEDLDNAGATGPGALAYLFGGTNSTPSATGLTYKANLQAKGWTVLTN